MKLLDWLYEKVFTSCVDVATPKEASKLGRKILLILYKKGPTICYDELKNKLRRRFKKNFAENLIQDAIYNNDYITHTAEGHVIKSISIKKEGVDFLRKEKETCVRNIREWGMLLAAIALVISTISIQEYTSNQTLEQEREFNGAHLSFWQNLQGIGAQNIWDNNLVSLNEANHEMLGFCVQNDGRASTGTIAISPIANKFTTYVDYNTTTKMQENFVVSNIPPGEGNCTNIYVWYSDCFEHKDFPISKEYCNLSLVPKGKQVIQFTRYCALCPKKDRFITENFTFCVQPSTDCR